MAVVLPAAAAGFVPGITYKGGPGEEAAFLLKEKEPAYSEEDGSMTEESDSILCLTRDRIVTMPALGLGGIIREATFASRKSHCFSPGNVRQ